MKDATGELSMTAVAVVAIAAILIVAVICIIRHFYNKRVTNKMEDLDKK